VSDDGVELLLHRQKQPHRPARDQRRQRCQRLDADVALGRKAAAQMQDLYAHAILSPSEQPRDLDAHE
jgi:hypothetical protein